MVCRCITLCFVTWFCWHHFFFQVQHLIQIGFGAWISLTLVMSLVSLLVPVQLLLEGCQKQELVYSSRIVHSIVYTLTLSSCLLLDFGLYSMALASLLAMVASSVYLLKGFLRIYSSISSFEISFITIKSVFVKIFPMLSKISVTWIMGYFFWNSFNLITFKYLPVSLAGKFSLTLALGLAGYNVADSIRF